MRAISNVLHVISVDTAVVAIRRQPSGNAERVDSDAYSLGSVSARPGLMGCRHGHGVKISKFYYPPFWYRLGVFDTCQADTRSGSSPSPAGPVASARRRWRAWPGRAHASPQNGFARGLGPVGNSAGASPFTVIPPHHQRFAHWCLRFRRRQRCLNDLCVHLIFGARALLGLEQAG